jgi:hypothetical protein
MTWRNPLAWLGLLAIAVPIAVHLLGRRRPAPIRFPTLQFLGGSPALPRRRHRLNDVPLMFLRIAIVVAAVAALADPALVGSPSDNRNAIARAIVVDTSASMDRATPAGRPAREEARALAKAHEAGATVFRTIEAPDLRPAIARARTWVAEQPGRRVIVVVSDFQTGAIDASDLALIPAEVGMAFDRVDTAAERDVPGPTVVSAGGSLTSRLRLSDAATEIEWRRTPASTEIASPLLVLNPADEQRDVEAALEAAVVDGLPALARDRDVVVVFPRSPDREKLRAEAHAVDEPWMFEAVKAIREDPVLATLPCSTRPCPATSFAAGRVNGTPRLLIFVEAAPRDLIGATVLRAAWRAAADVSPIAELEPRHVADSTLASWGRPASEAGSASPNGEGRPMARWLWLLALVLLGVETWMRLPVTANESEATHARVA